MELYRDDDAQAVLRNKMGIKQEPEADQHDIDDDGDEQDEKSCSESIEELGSIIARHMTELEQSEQSETEPLSPQAIADTRGTTAAAAVVAGETSKKASSRRKPNGRKAIPASYILKNKARSVTFSKRKNGIMKKVYQIVAMTGCNAFVLIQQLPTLKEEEEEKEDEMKAVATSTVVSKSNKDSSREGSPQLEADSSTPPPPFSFGAESRRASSIEIGNRKTRNNYAFACKTWRHLFHREEVQKLIAKRFTPEDTSNTALPYELVGPDVASPADHNHHHNANNSFRVRTVPLGDRLSAHSDSYCTINFQVVGSRKRANNEGVIILDGADDDDVVEAVNDCYESDCRAQCDGVIAEEGGGDGETPAQPHWLLSEAGAKTKKRGTRGAVDAKFIENKKKRGTCFCKRKGGILSKAFELVGMTHCRCLVVLSYPEQEGGSDLYHVYCSPDWRQQLLSGGLLNLLYQVQQVHKPMLDFFAPGDADSRAAAATAMAEHLFASDEAKVSLAESYRYFNYCLPSSVFKRKVVPNPIEDSAGSDAFVSFVWKGAPPTRAKKAPAKKQGRLLGNTKTVRCNSDCGAGPVDTEDGSSSIAGSDSLEHEEIVYAPNDMDLLKQIDLDLEEMRRNEARKKQARGLEAGEEEGGNREPPRKLARNIPATTTTTTIKMATAPAPERHAGGSYGTGGIALSQMSADCQLYTSKTFSALFL